MYKQLILSLYLPTAISSCVRNSASESISPLVLSPEPWTYIDQYTLPERWDWRNVSGINYVTTALNQHIPVYCGSCWLHAGIATLNDRLKIARNARWPEITLARQVLLNCGGTEAGNCSGGSDYGVYVFAHRYGIPDDTCQPYVAKELECDFKGNCANCDPDLSLLRDQGLRTPDHDSPSHSHRIKIRSDQVPNENCYAVQRYGRFFVTEYGKMIKPEIWKMQAEIWKRGPISCSVDAEALEYAKYKPGDIINASLDSSDHRIADVKTSWEPDHDVSVVGWDADEHGIFWIVRNSWGSYWGDHGWFKVRAGFNSMGIEDLCHWAVIDAEPRVEDYGPSDCSRVFASSPYAVADNECFQKSVIPRMYRGTQVVRRKVTLRGGKL